MTPKDRTEAAKQIEAVYRASHPLKVPNLFRAYVEAAQQEGKK